MLLNEGILIFHIILLISLWANTVFCFVHNKRSVFSCRSRLLSPRVQDPQQGALNLRCIPIYGLGDVFSCDSAGRVDIFVLNIPALFIVYHVCIFQFQISWALFCFCFFILSDSFIAETRTNSKVSSANDLFCLLVCLYIFFPQQWTQ